MSFGTRRGRGQNKWPVTLGTGRPKEETPRNLYCKQGENHRTQPAIKDIGAKGPTRRAKCQWKAAEVTVILKDVPGVGIAGILKISAE